MTQRPARLDRAFYFFKKFFISGRNVLPPLCI